MPTEPTPITIADAVRRAVRACDPTGEDGAAAEALARFEDRDEPIASLEDPDLTLAEGFGALDPQEEDGALQMIRAVATYLAFRRDEAGEADEQLLRLAARAEYDGNPPDVVRAWLESRGVAL
jgi:hypothetical protein